MQAGTLPFARRRPSGLGLGKALICVCKLLNLKDKFVSAWVAWGTLAALVEVCLSVYGFIGRLVSSWMWGMAWAVGYVFGAWVGWCVPGWLADRGVAGGPWGWLLGRWPACSRLRCGAQPWGGGAVTRCALPGAKLRSDNRAKFDVEVRLAAHPPHGLRASPPAKSPPPRPARHTTLVTGWCAQRESKSRANFDSC